MHVQTVEADAPIPTGHVYLSASFDRENTELPAQGTLSLYIRDEKVGEQMIITQPGKFGLGGGGLVSDDPGPSRSRTTTPATRPGRSSAARSNASSSTSAASPSPTWLRRPERRSRTNSPRTCIATEELSG